MRKTLLMLVVAALLLFSCKKDHSVSTTPSGKKYKVVFNVSNFSQQRAAFALKLKALAVKQHNLADSVVAIGASSLDVLYYYVFDNTTPGFQTIHAIAQDSTFCDQFGIITDSLPAGHYTVALVAGKKGLMSENGGDMLNTFATYGGLDWQDLFFYRTQIDVAAAPASYDVTLHREISKLELQLLDSIPPAAKTIKMAVVSEFSAFSVEDQAIDGGNTDTGFTFKTIPVSAIGKPNFIVDRIQGATAFYMNVYITCFDASNHVIAHTVVNGVKCNPNMKTILSGKLFGNSAGQPPQAFTVTADTTWGSTIHRENFGLKRLLNHL